MTSATSNSWQEANTRYLLARLAVVGERVTSVCRGSDENAVEQSTDQTARIELLEHEAVAIAESMDSKPALEHLCEAFDLSLFERDLLLLCAGVELSEDFAQLYASAPPHTTYPTFRLALNALTDANWGAITPAGPLRLWRLIEVERGDTLATSPLRIDERVLHYLVGTSYLDERLAPFFSLAPVPSSLPSSYRDPAERVVSVWSQREGEWPVIHLSGDARDAKRTLAAASCAALGLRMHILRISEIPNSSLERETLFRLWQREALLIRSALLLESDDRDDVTSLRNAKSLVEQIAGPVFTTSAALLHDAQATVVSVEVNRPSAAEQRALWDLALGDQAASLNGELDRIVSQFQFDAESIRSLSETVRRTELSDEPENFGRTLWQVCRAQSRSSLDGLADSIETRAQWEDLVLPEEQLQTLGEIAAQVRQRTRVYESWGFAARSNRGLGISALFAGPSGTGKTLAAEVLANNLQLDLFRIDLSQVVSKYIGETEKNLRAVFDSAEACGAVLLFDEADALFGKRSEVRDSHDRYANIEVSYLLQRMESYRGLAILTTNRRSSLDTAFLRRIRFVVTFPFPDAALRNRIWSRIFPLETPIQNLDLDKLARLNVTGGNIRNIALNAAFLAADLDEPVRMTHLLRTARSECAKIEKQVTAAEIGGWV
jgi:SpoVK/Ycf46/Vps4 family AAA+-type ATPase